MMLARESIERIYRDAVLAVDPRACVRAAIEARGTELRIGGHALNASDQGVFVVAIGKASAQMTAGALDAMGERVRRGIVVTKQPEVIDHDSIAVLRGAHPVPDQLSLNAGQAVLEFSGSLPDGALAVCLISGGGSALIEALRDGVSLDALQDVTRRLLRAGATINELNAVRSRLSRIKGGGLLAALRHARVVNLIVSDVLGDDLQTIASGPTVKPSTGLSAEDVLAKFGVDFHLPDMEEKQSGGPVVTRVVANLDMALDAAANAAHNLGYNPVVLTNRIEGEARVAGRLVASMLLNSARPFAALPPGSCLIAGGETTVTVRGDGEGGRNTEAALAAAIELSGSVGLTVGFLASDGDDGTTGAAGAIADGATIPQSEIDKAQDALRDNDSFGYLSRTGAVWSPGATGTNVNDLVIGIVE